jgi:hypothetical protein
VSLYQISEVDWGGMKQFCLHSHHCLFPPKSPHLRVLLGLNGRKERFLLDRGGKKSP